MVLKIKQGGRKPYQDGVASVKSVISDTFVFYNVQYDKMVWLNFDGVLE